MRNTLSRRTFLGLASAAALVLEAGHPAQAAPSLQDLREQLPVLLTQHLADLTLRDIDLCERAQTQEVTGADLRRVRRLVAQYVEG